MKYLVSPRRLSNSVIDGVGRGCLNGVRGGDEDRLPCCPVALWEIKNGVLQPDSIGLLITDYLLVPANNRSTYFADESTMYDAATILTNIEASLLVNSSGLIGGARGYAQFPIGTPLSVILKGCKYFRETCLLEETEMIDSLEMLDTLEVIS